MSDEDALLNRRKAIGCATGIDLDRAVADGRMALDTADTIRAFASFCEASPPPGKPITSREQGMAMIAALRDMNDPLADDLEQRINARWPTDTTEETNR